MARSAARSDAVTSRRRAADPFIVVGAGIAGLATALALAEKGFASCVLERRSDGDQTGAGIQVGPNGVRVLEQLGVASMLRAVVAEPRAIVVRDARDARLLAEMPLGQSFRDRHGAPYWVAHRADLHAALSERAASQPRINVMTGFDVAAFREQETDVEVRTTGGTTVTGRAIVGADGLYSRIRELLLPGTRPRFSGMSASRAVVRRVDLGPPFSTMDVGLWLAPALHVVHYPVRGGDEIAFVVVIDEGWRGEDWSAPVDRRLLTMALADFDPLLADTIATIGGWRKWALSELGELSRWSGGPATLVGDAAHPMLPFLAQGGVMALEDSIVLADAVAQDPSDIVAAFKRYERARRTRVKRVQTEARRNRDRYHWRPPQAWARNLALKLAGGERLIRSYDWLYGWRGPAHEPRDRGGAAAHGPQAPTARRPPP